MNATDIRAINGTEYFSETQAKEAIQGILDFAGVKENCKTDYCEFLTLQKDILIRSGIALYSIWIKNSYNNDGKKVWQICMQMDYSLSMSIREFILEAVNEGRLLLSAEMKQIITI